MTYRIRFIHKTREKSHLPTEWNHPRADERFEGCQTLSVWQALDMIETGEDARDDWFNPENYSHVSIIKCSGFSGDCGPLPYKCITEDDVESMHVIEYSDNGIQWELMEIALELIEEGHDIELDQTGYPECGWWDEVGEGVVLERLLGRCEKVALEFVDLVQF